MLTEYDPSKIALLDDELDAEHDAGDRGTCQQQTSGRAYRILICTRPERHDGDHIAGHSSGLIYAIWSAEDPAISTKHRVIPSAPKVCRRCNATSTGGKYCPNGCGPV